MSADPAPGVAELVRAAQDPRQALHCQHAAFTTLVERFEAMAFAAAFSQTGDVESARDASQQAFLEAWRRLPTLRDPAAFGGWLKRLVRTQCARARRRADGPGRPDGMATIPSPQNVEEETSSRDTEARVRGSVAALPAPEREAVVLFYFLGESLRDTARAMGTTAGTAGKRLHSARLRLRRTLSRDFATAIAGPSTAFSCAVLAGVFREFEGEYRFPERPRQPVLIRRVGNLLLSYAGGQRNVLASRERDTLTAVEFDGEARFERYRNGRIRQFVYYEFGRRLGVARKVRAG